MIGRIVCLAAVAMLIAAGCGQSADVGAGRVLPDPVTEAQLYAPVDRAALAFGLPDVVAGTSLVAPPDEAVRAKEAEFARDLLIKPELVRRGLGPAAVSIEQRSDRFDEFPRLATSAIWVRGVPADTFAEFDPSFYLLLTSVTDEQYRWTGEKPGRHATVMLDRPVWSSDWETFQVVWYTWGEVLYVVLAENPQLLESTLRSMPLPPAPEPAA